MVANLYSALCFGNTWLPTDQIRTGHISREAVGAGGVGELGAVLEHDAEGAVVVLVVEGEEVAARGVLAVLEAALGVGGLALLDEQRAEIKSSKKNVFF